MLKNIAAKALLFFIVASTVAGIYALSLMLPIALIAGAMVFTAVKLDDVARARRARIVTA